MITVKTKVCEFCIIDTPIKDDWDLLCAISGAELTIKEAVGEIYYLWGNKQRNSDMLKVSEAVFDNLRKLIIDYMNIDAAKAAGSRSGRETPSC